MNKQQLSAKIWASANEMRGKIAAADYKDFILGFIFYKYLSDNELNKMKKQGLDDPTALSENDSDIVTFVQDKCGYFISYDNLFSHWLDKGADFTISDVYDALSAFKRLVGESHKDIFENIFYDLEIGLKKLGSTAAAQSKAVRELIWLIKDIPTGEKSGYDVLGYVYEDLISKFASSAGKKAGEFYTPHEVSTLISDIIAEHLKDRKEIEIYDPASGSASLLINIGRSADKYLATPDRIKYYAQELITNTYNLTRMNLIMRGIKPANIVTRNADTLKEDWPVKKENGALEPLFVDAVVANPPYSQKWDPAEAEGDPRFDYGYAPRGKADYAFLLHNLYHIKPDGIVTIVLPHGVLFRGGEEGAIRKNLIENNNIDTIIGLPANIFFGTGIPTIIMILKKNKTDSNVLIIDASKGFTKQGTNNILRACDIRRIADTIRNRSQHPKYSRLVSRDEIRENDYNLNIPRYVDSSEEHESWDICGLMTGAINREELTRIGTYLKAFPTLAETLFTPIGDTHFKMAVTDIAQTIRNHSGIKNFEEHFRQNFAGFDTDLTKLLIDGLATVDINTAEEKLCCNIFTRMENIPLIDKYAAYQLLDDLWENIAGDIENIHTESPAYDTPLALMRKVDPNMVIRKKKGREAEVQEGWKGHIFPFELVADTLLAGETATLKEKEDRLASITSEQQEIIDSLSEDDKDELKDILNDNDTAFLAAPLKSYVKDLLKNHPAQDYDPETPEGRAITSYNLNGNEKKLKKDIKQTENSLNDSTRQVIENLTTEEARTLLHEKWITPLMDSLNSLPAKEIDTLISKVETIAGKYSETLPDIERDIRTVEQELKEMMDNLTGSPSDMQGIRAFQDLLGGE